MHASPSSPSPRRLPGTGDHWAALAAGWELSGPPLRVSDEDLAAYREVVAQWAGERPPRVLLLGVTPEIYRLPWPQGTDFLAADRQEAMIEAVWPGPRDLVLHEDWTELSLADGARDIVVCDGGFHLLAYPEGQIRLVRSLARVLAEGGVCALRLFVPPVPAENPGAVLTDVRTGRVPSVNALKLRLGMALQGDPVAGIELGRIWDTFRRELPDTETAQRATGWPAAEVRSLDAYRDSRSRYHFVGLEEVKSLFCEEPGGFVVESLRVPTYDLGERCPLLVLRRRR